MNILDTKRLQLRPFQMDDAPAVFRNWTQDERVARYCRWYPHQSIQETEEYLKICLSKEYCWAIVLKDQNELIGCIDVVGKNCHNVDEIGYVLSYKYWNRGLMSEALEAVIEELFQCGFEILSACHDVDNPASGKVMEKCGMKYIENDMAQKKFGSDEQIEVRVYEIKKNAV